MPRLVKRRKASTDVANNNNTGEDEPKIKMSRTAYQLPLPERVSVVGRALVCGQGDMGQLGLGDDEAKMERKRPALVEGVENVVAVCAGGMHNLVLTNEGRIFSFGCNDEGALGRDSSAEGSEFEPKEVNLVGKVVKMSAGDSHSACLLEDGRVFAWGSFRDSHGNMGLSLEGNKRLPIDVLPNIKCCDIASGGDHLVMLTCNGKVYTVGCGEQGQLGRISARSINGEGRRGKTELLRPGLVSIKRAKNIDAIWASSFCTFLREYQTGIIYAFGLNNYHQLAYSQNTGAIVNPIMTGFTNVAQIAGGQHHTLVLNTDGSCHVIGRRDYGRLGLGTLEEDVTEITLIKTLQGKKIKSITCGDAQSFALTEDGKLYAWGMGSQYQLGTGSEDDALEPVMIVSKQTQDKRVIAASGGGQHSIFIVEDEIQPEPSVTKTVSKSSLKKNTASSTDLSKDNSMKDIQTNGSKEEVENGETKSLDSSKASNEEQAGESEKAKPAKGRGRKKK